MYAVLKNLFFDSKLDLFLVLKSNFLCYFWILHPKKYKGANFYEEWPYRTQVITISLDTQFKMTDFLKKGPKITQISKADISGTV